MKVLILTNHQLTGNGGGAFASRAYINGLAVIADYTTLIYPYMGEGDIRINERVNCIAVDKSSVSRVRSVTNVFMSRLTHYCSTMKSELERLDYDYVVFDNSRTSFRLIEIAKKHGAKVVTIHHNYEYEYLRDNISGIRRLIYLFWVKRYEKEAIERSDLNITLTDQDKRLFESKFNVDQRKVVALGCFEYEAREDYKVDTESSSNNRFVITGNLSAMQSEESLLPWLKSYYPILKTLFSDAKLVIAGKSPSNRIKEATNIDGVKLIASPESMDEIIDGADIYLAPTSMGGGLKLRVMDGLRRGLMVVCHKVSSRGYEKFIENGCMLTYDDESSFKQSINEIKNRRVEKDKIIDIYDSIFRFESGVKRLKNIFEKL